MTRVMLQFGNAPPLQNQPHILQRLSAGTKRLKSGVGRLHNRCMLIGFETVQES